MRHHLHVTSPLTIAVAQPSLAARDVRANAQAHADVVRAAGARVVVFPELSLTGYELDAEAVSLEHPAFAPLVDACAAQGSIALAGAPVAEADGREYIATLRVDADGVAVAYRKMFVYGAEPARFSAGPGPVALEVDGWRLGLAICKDTGVAEHAEVTAALGIDVYVAGVVHLREELAEQEARVARIAGQTGAYVAMASCAAPTGGGFDHTAGHSGIWSPEGQVLAQAGPAIGEIVRATLDPELSPARRRAAGPARVP